MKTKDKIALGFFIAGAFVVLARMKQGKRACLCYGPLCACSGG